MEAIERLVADEEIRQLAYRYALAMDSRDLTTLVELFVDDVQLGAEVSGRDALYEFFDASLRRLGTSILHVTNHVIDLAVDHDGLPDAATGVVYCRGELEIDGQWVIQAIQYRDTYARRDGHWYFVRRRHLLWYGVDVLTRPIGLPPANWPANDVGKGELPEYDASWRSFYGQEAPDP